VPFNRIPYLEALTASASYNATYTWNRTAQRLAQEVNPGNTISSTAAWQADGQINFETLYGKSKYWKQLNQRFSSRGQRRAFRPKNYSETVNLEANVPVEIVHRLNSEALDVIVMDSKGKKVNVKVTTDGTSKIQITSKKSINDVSVKISTRNPNQRTASQLAGDFMAYFGTMVRRLQVTYRHTNSLTMPGFSPQVGFMGQSHIDNAYAPGWDFAFGFISDDYVQKAKDRGWLYVSNELSQPALKANTSDFDVKLVLEPFPGFKVQVNGKRYNAQSSSLLYSVDSMGVYALQDNMTGSYNITQVAIGTAFAKIGAAEDNFSSEVFTQFLANRNIMANRIQQRYANVLYPSDGFMTGGDYAALRGQTYDASNGGVNKNSADVLVPAFFAAYTGRDIHNVKFNPFLSILNILPNWSVTFDGLGRIPWLRERFKSITLTHAYTCKYAIGSYSSYSTWVGAAGDDKTIGFTRDVVTGNPVPSTAFDISSVNLTESFSPLIGLNMTMKNSLAIKAEYRKQRTLALNVTSIQITEGHTNEFVIGAGYTVKDLSFVAKSKGGKQKKVSNDLKINVDVSYKNIMTLLRKVEENITQASSGNKVFGIKLSADYVLSQKVSLQLYYDHEGTTPLISSSYPIKSDNVGINVKLMLTR
jgi:cell surface protein SprA